MALYTTENGGFDLTAQGWRFALVLSKQLVNATHIDVPAVVTAVTHLLEYFRITDKPKTRLGISNMLPLATSMYQAAQLQNNVAFVDGVHMLTDFATRHNIRVPAGEPEGEDIGDVDGPKDQADAEEEACLTEEEDEGSETEDEDMMYE